MDRRDLRGALAGADRLLREHPEREAARRRVRARLAAGGPRVRVPRWTWALASTGAAALVAGVLLWPRGEPLESRVPARFGTLQVVFASDEARAHASPDGTLEVVSGQLLAVEPDLGIRVALAAGTRVRMGDAGLRVRRGSVAVAVAKRASAAPVRIRVSHGVIEVVGTRFTVEQAEGNGRVTLHEGAIRFVWPEGDATPVAPGESLRWPRDAVRPRPPPAPTPPAPPRKGKKVRARRPASPPAVARVDGPRPTHPAPSVPAILERVSVLRSRGELEKAVRELGEALGLRLSPATRERLSFELGTILTHHLRDRARACAHWRGHLSRHPGGRYAPEVQDLLEELGCGAIE